MKFTEDTYKKAYREALDLTEDPSNLAVLSRMAGEGLQCYQFEFLSYACGTSREERSRWVQENLISKFSMEPVTSIVHGKFNMSDKTWKVEVQNNMYLGEDIVLFSDGIDPNMVLYRSCINDKIKELIELWYTWISPKITTEKETTRFVNIMLHSSQRGFFESTIPLGSKIDIDIKENYMPELPDSKIQEKIRNDHGGFLIFNGDPGTGKSTYIKYLMETMTDINFVILDPNALQGGAEEFKNYVIQNSIDRVYSVDDADSTSIKLSNTSSDLPSKNPTTDNKYSNDTVYILEDAEKLLLKRSEVTNPVNLSNILNITDGVIGDLVKVKFICTFNCDLSEIDAALLRKGRLLQKYEFPKLSGETLKNLADSLGIPENKRKSQMSLAEIYGWDTDNGISESEKGKIGF